MLTESTYIFFVTTAVLFCLLGIHAFFAIFHDRAVSTAAPIRTLEAVVADIENKRAIRDDIDAELQARRKALANIADIQAEYDATQRQLDELKAEWLQLDERRAEIRRIRDEMETSLAEKTTLDSELAVARADLDGVQDRLVAAEQLFAKLDYMKKEHAELTASLDALRSQVRNLEEAEHRISTMTDQANEIERQIAQLNGQYAAVSAELELTRQQQSAERNATVEARGELTQVSAKVAAAEERSSSIFEEIRKLEDARAKLQAQIARMEEQAGESSGASEESIQDKLKELTIIPPVLLQLREWKERDVENEADAIKRVLEHLRKSGLEYPDRVVKAFHTAMKVNETAQMAVLAGISGTGKSQLPRQYAYGMGIGFLQVPVQPRWDSPQDLMGFYNYIEKRFRPTDMARALYQLDYLNNENSEFKDRMLMVLLDEMNLARVEYYFSDFLSRLESRPAPSRVSDNALRKDAEIELEIPMPKGANAPRIFPGYNLLFAGTMNEDESTQSLSDKVVDRANVLRFAAPKDIKIATLASKDIKPEALSAKRWNGWIRPPKDVEGDTVIQSSMQKMIEIMTAFNKPFGHRLGKSIIAYAANYPRADRGPVVHAPLADQVEMRLLPKLRGLEVQNFEEVFNKLRDFVEKDLHDEALAKAIEDSRDAAVNGSGQFVWNGVIR